MRLALEEAQKAALSGEVPVGAILVGEDAVLARGHNERESKQDPTAHAEMIVIRAAAAVRKSWHLEGTTLYVTMEPCPMCIGACLLARIRRVVFGVYDQKGGACGSIVNLPLERRFNHRIEVRGEVLEQESRELLQSFFRNLRVR
jgi:tRNA(adenine34) deaminase